jgi:hypothetical protein
MYDVGNDVMVSRHPTAAPLFTVVAMAALLVTLASGRDLAALPAVRSTRPAIAITA